MVNLLESTVSLQVGGQLGVHLLEILVDILVAFFESLLCELGDLALHHALLVSEQTVRSSKEALESNYFLEESELGVSLLVDLGFSLSFLLLFDCLLDG